MDKTAINSINSIAQTYSVDFEHVAIISDAAQRWGINKSAALRRIIREWNETELAKQAQHAALRRIIREWNETELAKQAEQEEDNA